MFANWRDAKRRQDISRPPSSTCWFAGAAATEDSTSHFQWCRDHIPGNYTTKDRLSLCFPSKITGVLEALFQTHIYHVDRFGHILQQYLASYFL